MPPPLTMSDKPITEIQDQLCIPYRPWNMDISPVTSHTVDVLVRPLTPANRSLRFLETGVFRPSAWHVHRQYGFTITHRALPIDPLLLHEARSVREWPSADHEQLLAVAHHDIHVARHDVAEMTRYLDLHSAQLSACAGAMNESLPLMTVETFLRLPGSVCAALDSLP